MILVRKARSYTRHFGGICGCGRKEWNAEILQISSPILKSSGRSYIRLSPNKISSILQKNEFSKELNLGSVKSFDTNQLASNSPIEDTQTSGRCILTTGLLFGIFDGHGGPACGQVIAKRLFRYIAAGLLPRDTLLRVVDPQADTELLEYFNDQNELVDDLKKLYNISFTEYLKHLVQGYSVNDFCMSNALENAFVKLDEDIGRETNSSLLDRLSLGLNGYDTRSLLLKTLSVALSGAVGIVAHIDGEHLHIANCGDCQAVLGSWNSETNDWHPTLLSSLHNAENFDEVSRIYSEHPENEHDTVIRNGRLLGQLIPLRAFGDYKFKWSAEETNERVSPHVRDLSSASAPHSLTPPYLMAKPEVTYHKLHVKDSFLILASDGLWDMLSYSQAVRLVGEHMSGKTVLSPYALPTNTSPTLGEIHQVIKQRAESFKVKPEDQNAATHLTRHALGGSEHGIDNSKLSSLLTLPDDSVRLFRDDITITVIFFDSDFISQRPL